MTTLPWAADKSWGCLCPRGKEVRSFYWILELNVKLVGGSQLPLKSQLADFLGFRGREEEGDLLEEELQPWETWAHFIFGAVP